MAQTYGNFKTYALTEAWRENDTVLATNLDQLILHAHAELDKMTKDWQRREKTAVIAPTSQDFDLTANVSDLVAVKSVVNNQTSYYRDRGPEFSLTTLSDIYQRRTRDTNSLQAVYATDNDDGTKYLRFVAPFSVTDPAAPTDIYTTAIPDYAGTDASWFEDEYPDLYLSSVLKRIALFSRDDERLPVFTQMQADAFNLADLDDKHNLRFGGSPMQQRPHRVVP